jgi:hypothetical protein
MRREAAIGVLHYAAVHAVALACLMLPSSLDASRMLFAIT